MRLKSKDIFKIIIVMMLCALSAEAVDLTLTGSVMSDNRKIITSRYMGFVIKVGPSEGESVKKGTLLYAIDSKEIDSAKIQVELAIEQAKLALSMYINQYQNVKLNLSRYKRLYKQDMVSKYQVENLQLAAKNLRDSVSIAKKQVEQAQAKLKEVDNQYKYLRIKAPNNSVVVARNIKVGEMAMPGMPAYILSDLSDLRIVTQISEDNLKYIKLGKKVMIDIPSVGLKEVGIVSAIVPSSNPLTHSFQIKIKFNKKNKEIYPGMYATVTVR